MRYRLAYMGGFPLWTPDSNPLSGNYPTDEQVPHQPTMNERGRSRDYPYLRILLNFLRILLRARMDFFFFLTLGLS